jgi:hypothetical protein
VKATQKFIRSLPERRKSDVMIVGWYSQVLFLRSERGNDGQDIPFKFWLNHFLEGEDVVIVCMGTSYDCTLSAWFGYLREILRPLAGDLLADWRHGVEGPEGRLPLAAALALVAPDTKGLVEVFRQAIEGGHKLDAILFLREMGPLAASAAPSIERALADSELNEEGRAIVNDALKKIRR